MSRLRRWSQTRWARRLVRLRELFPLTNLGVLVLALGVGTYLLFAAPRADYVLQLASALAASLVALAILVVLPGAWLVARAYRRAQAAGGGAMVELEASRGFAVLLELPSFRAFPVLHLDWRWVSPQGFPVRLLREGGVLREEVSAHERADVEAIQRRFEIEDAFGLARVVLYRTEVRPVRAVPHPGKLSPAPMLRSQAGGEDLSHPLGVPEGDRVEMRHYVPGDPLRLALWKIYARTGELLVRMPERAVSPSWRILAYLVAADGDEPAAAAARVAIGSGLMGEGWRFSADGAGRIADDRAAALALVVQSRAARGTPAGDGAGLEAFLRETGELSRRRLVLFLPATPGPWLPVVSRALRGFGGRATAIVATDVVRDQRPESPRWERLLRRPADADPGVSETTIDLLGEVVGTLAASGAEVVAVERPTGRILSTSRATSAMPMPDASSGTQEGVARA